MDVSLSSRIKNAWNVFRNRDPTKEFDSANITYNYSVRPDRVQLTRGNERSILTSIYNRIALDVSSISIKHCKLDENDRFVSEIKSGLNTCLNLEANLDQTGKLFIHDIVMSMLDEGCVAVVPVDTSIDPTKTDSYDILTMRTGKILQWRPNDVLVQLYNERTGKKENIWVPKRKIAIIENPLYAVVNEPNSMMQRLKRKLVLLDITDENIASNKLDLIIQLPYTIKTDTRRQQAERRRQDIEQQLTSSKYGIAYSDGTEKIIQLNRPIENNLLKQVEFLTNNVYSQLGLTQEILSGKASEQEMLNYYAKILEPILNAIVDEMKRKFLTKTARTQHQSIMYFRDSFKLISVTEIAKLADTLTRNEIFSSNEIRQMLGRTPSDDPKADELRNSNMPQNNDSPIEENTNEGTGIGENYEERSENQNGKY